MTINVQNTHLKDEGSWLLGVSLGGIEPKGRVPDCSKERSLHVLSDVAPFVP